MLKNASLDPGRRPVVDDLELEEWMSLRGKDGYWATYLYYIYHVITSEHKYILAQQYYTNPSNLTYKLSPKLVNSNLTSL